MKTIKNTFRKKRIPKLILLLILSVLLTMQIKAQEDNVDQINLPGDIDGASGLAGDIITADGKVFVYTSQNILVYNQDGSFNKSISITDSTHQYGKFAPLYFWPAKYVADNQMMTHNPDEHLLYVLAPNLDIVAIHTQDLDVRTTWEWVNNESLDIQTPMHGFAILKYDNIRQRLFLIINSRTNLQSNPISFHSRSVYLSIDSISPNGLERNQMHSEINHLANYYDYNKTIFDVEFNDINDEYSNQYSHFYLARRYVIETCELLKVGNDNYTMSVISKYPNLDLLQDSIPGCPHPGKFTKLLYVHNGDIHKILAVPYRMPVMGTEPSLDSCNVRFPIVDLDDTAKNQSIISPNKRIIDVAFMEGPNDLIMCFGDKDENFNPDYTDKTDYDLAIFHYNSTSGKFNPSLGDSDNWINSNNTERNTEDNFVKLNIPLRIVKNANNPNNSFFLCKANEIVKFDFSGGTYIPESRYIGKGSHFFLGASLNDQTYILNTAKSGFEAFTGDTHDTTVQTGFQALRLCPDPVNRKLYVYNDLNIHAGEVFITNLDSSSADAVRLEHEGLLNNTAVGSIAHNPKQNHVLIAKNSEGGGILVLEAGTSSILANQPTTLQNISPYVREMFISPKGFLYVMLNSRNEDPVIKMLDANNSAYVEVSPACTLDVFEQDNFTTYNAEFCYNPYNDSVYAIVTTNNITWDPYFTAKNTTAIDKKDSVIQHHFFRSVLINTDRQQNHVLLNNIQIAKQIICPSPDELPQGYKGELIINAGFTDEPTNHLSGLLLYNCASNSVLSNAEHNYNQITYSKANQKIYGFEGKQDIDHTAHISNFFHTPYIPHASFPTPENFGHYDGQVLNIFANPYDNKLYVHTKVDTTRLGEDPMKLLTFNMADLSETTETDLGNRGHYVELDQNAEAMYFYYPTTYPYIDPYKNKIYLPNGGHSNVSVVEFVPLDQLYVHFSEFDESNWLSIPRMVNNESTNWNEHDLVEDVFHMDRFETGYKNYFQLKYEKSFEGNNSPYTNTWTEQGDWIHAPDENAFSVRGYKMKLDPDSLSDNKLYLYGNIKLPTTTFPVYKDTKNWIGYFLIQDQDVFDALEDHIEDIEEIWHQDYYCYRPDGSGIIFGPEGGGHSAELWNGPEWACSKSVHRVEYGDMLIINATKTFDGDSMFYWSNGGFTPRNAPRPKHDYYSYVETDTYKPFIIELDSTVNPQEIGAFVGNTCVGACSVIEPDTAVILLAYINPGQEDSVTFEEHYSTKSISNVGVKSYTVLNEEKGVFEKRIVKTSEGFERAFISFKREEKERTENINDSFRIWPNPASNLLNYSFTTDEEAGFSTNLYNISGKHIARIVQGQTIKGFNSGHIKLKDSSGMPLKPGVYFVRFVIGDSISVKKLVIN